MREPFATIIVEWALQCRIVYDKFHVRQDANQPADEVRPAELFRKAGAYEGNGGCS